MDNTGTNRRALACSALLAMLWLGSEACGALRLVATATDADFDVPTTGPVTRAVMFSDVLDPITGIGITAGYTTVAGEFGAVCP